MSTAPVVLFLGPEEGEKQSAIRELREAMRNRHGDDLEEHTFYAFDTPSESVVALLQNGSLFGSGTIVRYRAVEHLKRKDEYEPLQRYAENPGASALLILESSEVSVAKGVEQAAGPKNKRVFWEMFDNQKHGWLEGYFRRNKVKIEPEAVELMLELVQNNTMELRQEADRLISFVGDTITVEEVDRYIYHAREESVFSLFDALMAHDLDHALDILGKLMAENEAVQILLGLSWQLDRLYHLQMLRAAGLPDGELFAELARVTGRRVNSKRAQKNLLSALRAYGRLDSERILVLTGEVDALLRTVPAGYHRGLMEQFLYSVVVRGGAWSPQGSVRSGQPWEFPAFAAPRPRV